MILCGCGLALNGMVLPHLCKSRGIDHHAFYMFDPPGHGAQLMLSRCWTKLQNRHMPYPR